MNVIRVSSIALGMMLSIAGQIMFLGYAYKRSVLWFFGCLFVPLIAFIFICLNFRDTSKYLALMFGGIFVAIAGCYLADINF